VRLVVFIVIEVFVRGVGFVYGEVEVEAEVDRVLVGRFPL